MGKWYRVRVRDRARAREHSSSFLFFFFFTPKFTYVVTICNFEFCYKWRAIHTSVHACDGVCDGASSAIIQRQTHALIGKTPYVRIGVASSCC